jgi:hypothetical protein
MFHLISDRPIAMPQITATEPPHKTPMPNNGFQDTIQEKKQLKPLRISQEVTNLRVK